MTGTQNYEQQARELGAGFYSKNFKNEHQVTALKNLKAKGKYLYFFDYECIAKIDNPHQAEATKYTGPGRAIGFKNEHQVAALKNLKAQKCLDSDDINSDCLDSYGYEYRMDFRDYTETTKHLPIKHTIYEYIEKIDNPLQAEAAKYTISAHAIEIKNEHQVAALKNLQAQQGRYISSLDSQYIIAKIDNHCQSDAIEAGKSLYSVLDMKCAGAVVDHSDF